MSYRNAARLLMVAAVAAVIIVFSLAEIAFGQTPDSTSSSSSSSSSTAAVAPSSTVAPSPVSTGPGLPPGPTIVDAVTITPVTAGNDVVLNASVTSPTAAVVPDPVCPEGSTPVFFSPQPTDWYCHLNTPPSTDVDPVVVLPATGFPTGWALLTAAVLSAFGLGLIAAGRPGAPARPRRCHR